MPSDFVHTVFWFRLIERGFLTAAVTAICIWLVWKYHGEIAKFRIGDEKHALPVISFAIGTPALIALLFVGYTYADLSNPIEARVVSTKGNGVVLQSVRGLNDARESDGKPAPSSPAGPAFGRWTEQNLQLIFNSLTGKTKGPLDPSMAARMLSVSLSIGCLNQDVPDWRTLIDGKDFAQIEKDVAGQMSSHAVSGSLCNALKLEFAGAGGVK